MKFVKAFCIMLVSLLALAGCGTEPEITESQIDAIESSPFVAASAYEYTTEQLTMEFQEDAFKAVSYAGDSKHHILCKNYHEEFFVISADESGNIHDAIKLETNDDFVPMAIAAEEENWLIASYRCSEVVDGVPDSVLVIEKYSSSGKVIDTLCSIEDVFCPLFLRECGEGYLLGINQEPTLETKRCAGQLYFLDSGSVVECDLMGNTVSDAITYKNGTVLLCVGTQSLTANAAEPAVSDALYCFDPMTCTMEFLLDTSGQLNFLGVSDTALYVRSGSELCELNLSDGTETRITGLVEIGISSNQTIIGGWTNGTEFILLTKAGRCLRVAEKEVANSRKTVTLGCVGGLSTLEEPVSLFNQTNNDYRIEIESYSDVSELGMLLASGDGPDLMELSQIPISSYQSKGVFQDLYGLMNADATVSQSDYLSSILQMMETDGKLYTFPVQFALWGMLVRDDYDETNPGITLDSLAELPAAELALTEPLETLVKANLGVFTQDNAQEEIVKILTISKSQINSQELSQNPAVLMPYSWYLPNQDIALKRARPDYAAAGWPGLSGEGLTVYSLCELAINSASKCPEGAWEVLKYMVSLEGQEPIMDYGMSISEAVLELQFQNAQEDGMTDEEVRAFRERIDNVAGIIRNDEVILTICKEEAQAFYSGDKTAEDVANLILDRVKIYLGEMN